ncbi:MAG: hypothetical protein IT561_19000 [Alphaproteobacteria bacterium]|nr:hypothetical protein [Alphaproteobacteria bacterium]
MDIRGARDPVDREWLHGLLDRLLALRDATKPPALAEVGEDLARFTQPAGPVSLPADEAMPEVSASRAGTARRITDPTSKADAATWALGAVAYLVEATVGWAVNHEVGRAMASVKGDETDPSAHAHEMNGAYNGSKSGDCFDDPDVAREALLALLRACPLPPRLESDLSVAIKALKLGEVMPLLRPARGRQRGAAFSLYRARLEAIEIVNYRHGSGITLEEARRQVAAELGVGAQELKEWQKVLPTQLGREFVAASIAGARTFGADVAAAQREMDEAASKADPRGRRVSGKLGAAQVSAIYRTMEIMARSGSSAWLYLAERSSRPSHDSLAALSRRLHALARGPMRNPHDDCVGDQGESSAQIIPLRKGKIRANHTP